MDLQLQGKAALVTGGSRGIGLRIVQRFAQEGCGVAFCGRDKVSLASAEREVRALGVPVFTMACDVCDPAAAGVFINSAAEALGGLDILVNNVGGASGEMKEFIDTTDEDWEKTYGLNIFHAARTTRLAAPHMIKRGGGSVVIIASISGWKPVGGPQYGTAKAAEIFLAPELALALAEHHIRVNTVCPGSILWPGNGWDDFRRQHPEVFQRFVSMGTPSGRLGTPEQVADAVVFVSSPRGGWINGAMIPVDGGQMWSSIHPWDYREMRKSAGRTPPPPVRPDQA
jgi:3-oxoacyl-[acyl-carrier protein] reductase